MFHHAEMSANLSSCLANGPFSPVSAPSEALQRLIDRKQLTPLFQPIIALDGGRIVGYEALIRGPENSDLHSPVV